jgi:hypothetical protein
LVSKVAQVLTRCPRSGLPQATHARLTVRQLAALTGPLLYWCPRCRAPHEALRENLWLESEAAAAPPRGTAAASPPEIALVAVNEDRRTAPPAAETTNGSVSSPWLLLRRRR